MLASSCACVREQPAMRLRRAEVVRLDGDARENPVDELGASGLVPLVSQMHSRLKLGRGDRSDDDVIGGVNNA